MNVIAFNDNIRSSRELIIERVLGHFGGVKIIN